MLREWLEVVGDERDADEKRGDVPAAAIAAAEGDVKFVGAVGNGIALEHDVVPVLDLQRDVVKSPGELHLRLASGEEAGLCEGENCGGARGPGFHWGVANGVGVGHGLPVEIRD